MKQTELLVKFLSDVTFQLEARETCGLCDNYLLLSYSCMTQLLTCASVRIHMIKLVTIMCMIIM